MSKIKEHIDHHMMLMGYDWPTTDEDVFSLIQRFYVLRDQKRDLKNVVDLCRSYFAGADLCYCEIGECEPCSNLRAKAEDAIKKLDGGK